MEGLIPMVYRAIKRNRVRSRYECLSFDADRTHKIPHFYLNGGRTQSLRHFHNAALPTTNGTVDGDSFTGGGEHGSHHRRSHSSATNYSFGKGFGLEDNMPMPQKQRMVRFRSIRMLSCLTGA